MSLSVLSLLPFLMLLFPGFCEQSPASVSLSLHSAAPFHGGSLSLFQPYSLSFGIFEQIQGFSRDLPCPALQPPHSHDGDIAGSIRCPCSQWTQSLALPAWGLGTVRDAQGLKSCLGCSSYHTDHASLTAAAPYFPIKLGPS